MWPLGFTSADAIAWAIAVVAGAAGTLVAYAAGARLGAALTLGVALVVVVIVVAMLRDSHGSAFGDDD